MRLQQASGGFPSSDRPVKGTTVPDSSDRPSELPPVCPALKANGEPCQAISVLDDGFCQAHSSLLPAPAERGRLGGLRSGEVRREQAKSVRDRLREKIEEQFELVWSAFESGMLSEDERARITAAVSALDQAYGRPPQSIVGDEEQPVTFVLASLLQRAREES